MAESTTTVTRPASADGGPPAPTSTPRRPRPRILVVAAMAVALLVAAWVLPGAVVAYAPADVRFADGAPAVIVDRFEGPAGTTVVRYDHGLATSLRVQLTPSGRLDGRVTDVRLVTQARPLLVQGPMSVADAAPGKGVRVEVPVRFDNCEAYHEREAMVVRHVDVHVQALGRTVVERLPLERAMMVRSPMLWQCPDRTIDRSDDRRHPFR